MEKRPPESSSTRRLQTRILLALLIILGTSLTTLGYYIINKYEESLLTSLTARGEHLARLVADNGARHIQQYSFFLLENLVLSVEQAEDLAFCNVFDMSGKSIIPLTQDSFSDGRQKKRPDYSEDILLISEPITSHAEPIGRVEVGMRLRPLKQLIIIRSLEVGGLALLLFLFLLWVIHTYLDNLIISPIREMAEMTKALSRRRFTTLDIPVRNDEVGQLAHALNEMSTSLKGLYEDLEEKVRERTMRLYKVNHKLRKAYERERQLSSKASSASRAKSQFLATMSHEIRTPLNSIIGMGDILWESKLTGEQRECVSAFKVAGENLLRIVDDVLDLSRIEAGEMSFEWRDFSLEETIEAVSRLTLLPAVPKGLDVAVSIAPDLPAELNGDAGRLKQLLANLLGNAVKFTKQGEIELTLEQAPHSLLPRPLKDDEVALRGTVRDTGVGITKEKQAVIFNRFTQADSTTTREFGGTGLGLTISKYICEQLDGDLKVSSILGEGSEFSFVIILKKSSSSLPNESASPLANREITVISPHPMTRNAALQIIQEMGGSCTAFKTAEEALATANMTDIVIMDEALGQTPLRRLLADCSPRPKKVLRMVRNYDISHASLPGVPLQLPLFAKDIITRLKEAHSVQSTMSSSLHTENNHAASMPTEQSTQTETPERQKQPDESDKDNLHILVAEDNQSNRHLMELYFRTEPYNVTFAVTGEEAVALWRAQSFDLILMDIEMPLMDGLTATRLIRSEEGQNGRSPTPIIALTAHALPEQHEKSRQAGCDSHLIKPFKRPQLNTLIETYVAKTN